MSVRRLPLAVPHPKEYILVWQILKQISSPRTACCWSGPLTPCFTTAEEIRQAVAAICMMAETVPP